MKFTITILFTLLFLSAHSQSIDSAWLEKNILSRFTTDTQSVLPSYELVDEKGNKKTLADYAGRVLYIDLWSTTCAPCIGQFPYQAQLAKRLKILQLDTAVLFININIEDSPYKWKNALQKYKPVGINLHCSDTTLYDNWMVKALPCHILLNRSGKLLGKDIVGPDNGLIDWLLYSTAKGVIPRDAILRMLTQSQLMEASRSASAFTDKEYAQWFQTMLPAFLEYNSWRKERGNR